MQHMGRPAVQRFHLPGKATATATTIQDPSPPAKEYIYIYYHVVGHKITYSVATLSYDNYYVNL